MNNQKFLLKNAVFYIIILLSFISCNKNNNSDSETSELKSNNYSIVLNNYTNIYSYDYITTTFNPSNLHVIQTLPAQTKITISPDFLVPDDNTSPFIMAKTDDNQKGWLKLTDMNLTKDFLEQVINNYSKKPLNDEEKFFIKNIFSFCPCTIHQDDVSKLIEYFYYSKNSQFLSFYSEDWFIKFILLKINATDTNAKTNPLVYFIKYIATDSFSDSELNTYLDFLFSNQESSGTLTNLLNYPSDDEKNTPLIQAVLSENHYIAEKLIKFNGIDFNYKNADGKTVKDYLKNCRTKYIVNIIENPPVIDYYEKLIKKIANHNLENIPSTVFYYIPATVYLRNQLLENPVSANNYDTFMDKLEIAEEKYIVEHDIFYDDESREKPDNTKPKAVKKSEKDIFPFLGYITTDDGSYLKVRKQPNINSDEITKIPQNKQVIVLDYSKKTDQIDNIIDYWYKIRINDKEGWCFGGFLSTKNVLNTKDDDILCKLDVLPMKTFYKFATAIRKTKIHYLDNTSDEIIPGEDVEVIACADPKYQRITTSIFSYYLVKYNFKCGIICGEDFANTTLYDDNECSYYANYALYSEYICKPVIYKFDKEKKECNKIDFYILDDNKNLESSDLYASFDENSCNIANIDWVEHIKINSKSYDIVLFNFLYYDFDINNKTEVYTISNEENIGVEAFYSFNSYYNSEDGYYSSHKSSYNENSTGKPYIYFLTYRYYTKYNSDSYTQNEWNQERIYTRTTENPYYYELTSDRYNIPLEW